MKRGIWNNHHDSAVSGAGRPQILMGAWSGTAPSIIQPGVVHFQQSGWNGYKGDKSPDGGAVLEQGRFTLNIVQNEGTGNLKDGLLIMLDDAACLSPIDFILIWIYSSNYCPVLNFLFSWKCNDPISASAQTLASDEGKVTVRYFYDELEGRISYLSQAGKVW